MLKARGAFGFLRPMPTEAIAVESFVGLCEKCEQILSLGRGCIRIEVVELRANTSSFPVVECRETRRVV